MYVPEAFRVVDEGEIEAFVRRYDFATIATSTPRGLLATHVPVVIRRESARLIIAGHVARENPHLDAMEGSAESLAIFHGPHSYVSPTWYEHSPAVPTWNYAVVHAYGHLRVRGERQFILGVLSELVHRYEGARPTPWRIEDLPTGFHDQLLSRIVGFEMPILRLEAKFKLGQNRPVEDRAGTIRGLEGEASSDASALAQFMRSYLKESLIE